MDNLGQVRDGVRLTIPHPTPPPASAAQRWGLLIGLGALTSVVMLSARPAIAAPAHPPDAILAQVNGQAGEPILLAQAAYPVRQDPLINDYADLIEPQDAEQIRAVLQQLRATHGIEAVVVTVPSIASYGTGDRTVEAFATRLFNTWGVGDAQRNDGVLVLLAVGDRTVRIEIGRGYSSAYDARMKTVIDEYMLPHFRNGSYSFGLRRGVEAMVDPITGSPPGFTETIPAAWNDVPLPQPMKHLLLGGGLLSSLLLLGWKGMGYVMTPSCPNCQVRMRLLGGSNANAFLNAGQQMEAQLKSVIHSVYECPSCQKRTQRQFAMPISRYKPCPHCRYKTITIDQQTTTVAPTYQSSGQALASRSCRHCHHTDQITIVLPRLEDSSSSSSSGGGGGGGGGGGSSSGGGASGSW